MTEALRPGLTGTARLSTSAAHSATSLGSGTVDVFSTPMMIALMEQAAVDCVERHLTPGQVTLGTKIDIQHTEATPIGQVVIASAALVAVDGRTLTFEVAAADECGPIGKGRHVRVAVDRERFLVRLGSRIAPTRSQRP